jgi:hypothetical protein
MLPPITSSFDRTDNISLASSSYSYRVYYRQQQLLNLDLSWSVPAGSWRLAGRAGLFVVQILTGYLLNAE